MIYKTLTQEEMDDAVVGTYKANEMDHYIHNVNKVRYEAMIPTLTKSAFKDRIQGLLDETNSRISEVTNILASTDAQLPSTIKIAESIARAKAKEVAAATKI